MDIAYAVRIRTGFQYVLDQLAPCSPYGAELARRPRLYAPHERDALEREWRNVQAALAGMRAQRASFDKINHLMMQLHDIRGTLRRAHAETLTEIELFEVKRFLLQLGLLAPAFAAVAQGFEGIGIMALPQALALLDPDGSRSAGFSVSSAYAKPLAAAREAKRTLEIALRQTPDGPERTQLLNERRQVVAREEAEVLAVRRQLTESLRPYLDAMLENAEMIGRFDFICQKAALAETHGAVMPRIGVGGLRFARMQNPETAHTLAEKGRAFTRVSIEAPQGVTIITGANMGGKSVALSTLVLQVLLCQAGFFAFAEAAETALFDQIFFISEDLTDREAGLSSFGAEVVRIRDALRAVQSGAYCFLALDEPARGTNPREGKALVAALATRLGAQACVAVLATHYDGVGTRAQAHYQAAGLRAMPHAAPGDDPLALIARHMDYGLLRVDAQTRAPQEALTVCRLLGLDGAVLAGMESALQDNCEGNMQDS